MSEWKTISLLELFTKDEKKEIKKFLIENKGKSPYELTGKLKELFGKWRNELEAKGILSDYLAYAFAQKLAEVGYDKMIWEFSKRNLKKVI
jgi:hypothetical protein